MPNPQTLLTPSDVLSFTKASKEFPLCELNAIFEMEFCEFTQCLGKAFYDQLLSDLHQYECQIYDDDTAYNAGDVVAFGGVFKVAIADTTGNTPDNVAFWANAPRFQTACFEDLWCKFLGPYLSWTMIRDQLPFVSIKIAAAGLTKTVGQTFEAANTKEYQRVEQSVLARRERAFTNLDFFMKKNNDAGCFDNYKAIANTCCGECGCTEEDCDCACDDVCVDEKSEGYAYRVG